VSNFTYRTLNITGGKKQSDEGVELFAARVDAIVQVSRYRGRSDIHLSPAFNFNYLHLYTFQQTATMPLQINIIHTGRKERHQGSAANTLVQTKQ